MKAQNLFIDYPHIVPRHTNDETWAACEGLRPETFHLQVFDLQHVAGLISVKLETYSDVFRVADPHKQPTFHCLDFGVQHEDSHYLF